MEAKDVQNNRVRKTVNDLVMAEMFLLQATIESATVIGDGISELSKQIGTSAEEDSSFQSSITAVLQRIADDAMEPYTSRYQYFKKMVGSDS
ncbi:MAG: hypothetical protein ACI9JM_000194 [Halioglobus sp.]